MTPTLRRKERKMAVFMWMLTALSLVGVWLNIKKKVSGFYIWLIGDIGWVYIDFKEGLTSQAVLFIVYSFLCIYGIYEWRQSNEKV